MNFLNSMILIQGIRIYFDEHLQYLRVGNTKMAILKLAISDYYRNELRKIFLLEKEN